MRIGMMQPYFFPYLGYFGLIHATDRWVVFDTPQYIRRGWVNRNRVLSDAVTGWKYARVPIANCASATSIRHVRIAAQTTWQQELFNSLDTYRLRNAPYYQQTLSFLQATLEFQTHNLTELLVHCLEACCKRLELPFINESFSKMNLQLQGSIGPGEWALETGRCIGATQYVNPPGGRELFSPDRFKAANIDLQFLHPRLAAYDQGGSEFIPGLSIIDAFMWNRPATVRDMVGDYELKAA